MWTKEKWWSMVISSTSKGKNHVWNHGFNASIIIIFLLDRNFVKGFLPSGNFSWRCFWKRIAIHAVSSTNKGNKKSFQYFIYNFNNHFTNHLGIEIWWTYSKKGPLEYITAALRWTRPISTGFPLTKFLCQIWILDWFYNLAEKISSFI